MPIDKFILLDNCRHFSGNNDNQYDEKIAQEFSRLMEKSR